MLAVVWSYLLGQGVLYAFRLYFCVCIGQHPSYESISRSSILLKPPPLAFCVPLRARGLGHRRNRIAGSYAGLQFSSKVPCGFPVSMGNRQRCAISMLVRLDSHHQRSPITGIIPTNMITARNLYGQLIEIHVLGQETRIGGSNVLKGRGGNVPRKLPLKIDLQIQIF